MGDGAEGRRLDRKWIIAAVVVALLLIGAGAYALTRGGTGTATPTPTPTVELTPSETPTPTISPTKPDDPYCVAFAKITAGGVQTGEDGDGVDFAELAARFTDLIGKYTAAAKLAPEELTDDYERVLGYLTQGKEAVNSRDIEELKSMVRNLDSLNDSMDSIEQASRQMCG